MGSRIYPKRQPPIFLKERREEAKLTQEQLAERIGSGGVSQATIQRWENWRDKRKGRRPDLNALAAIAEALGIDIGKLFRPPDEPTLDDLLRDNPEEVADMALEAMRAKRRRAG